MMSEIKERIIGLELIKWVVMPYLFLSFLGSFGRQEASQVIYAQSNIHTLASNQRASAEIHSAGLSSFYKILEYFEIEEEEDDDHHLSKRKPVHVQSLPLVLHKITSTYFFPPQRKVKLFILFHSWKAFLRF